MTELSISVAGATTPDPAFVALVRRHLKYLDPAAELDPDRELKPLGLDSMAGVDLLLDLEDEFGVVLPDRYLTQETFSTVRSLWTVMDLLARGAGEPA